MALEADGGITMAQPDWMTYRNQEARLDAMDNSKLEAIDIRRQQIFNHKVMGNTSSTAAWKPLHAGLTLEEGVRLKNHGECGGNGNSVFIGIAGATAALYAIGKATGAVIRVGKEFEQSMANVKAISGATEIQFKALEQNAMKLGATTKLYLDGGGNTYLHEVSGDTVQLVAGGTAVWEMDSNSIVSLSNNDSGTSNTLFGKNAGDAIQAGGTFNTLFGELAGTDLTTGDYNTFIGQQAGRDATTANANTFIGYEAGENVTGANSVAIGVQAGKGGGAVTADWNVCIVYASGYSMNGDSGNNTFVGRQAGYAITDADNSVLIGAYAGDVIQTGANNTIIRYNCDVDAEDRNTATIIGKGITLTIASDNVVELGGATNSMTYDCDNGDILLTSDVRTKKNIVTTDIGLDFINMLNPVKYNLRSSTEWGEELGVPEEYRFELPQEKQDRVQDGFIAQEVKEVMDSLGV